MNCNSGFTIILIVLIIIYFIHHEKENKIITKLFTNNNNNKKKVLDYNNIGNLYYYGLEDIEPDYQKALNNYKKVFLYDPNNENIPQIRKNINKIVHNINENNYDLGLNIIDDGLFIDDYEFGINHDINDYIIDLPLDNLPLDNFPENPNLNWNHNDNDNFNFNNNININNENDRIINDYQNVHDSLVNKTINSSINKLEQNTIKNKNLDQINKYLLEKSKELNLSHAEKEKIRQTILYIKSNNKLPIGNNKLEDNLILVGNRILNTSDNEQKNNMTTNLLYELKDCVRSDGHMYCTTGIANRIINSLHGIDELVVVTPKWAIHEEMMGKCGKIRDELEKIIDPNDEKFDDKLKDTIKSELKKEYVDENKILTEKDFNKEIEAWIDYI